MKKINSGKILMLFLLLAVTPLSFSRQADAASSKSKALAAYDEFLSQETIPWGENEVYTAVPAKNCSFAIAYIDNNSVPELIVYNSSDITHLAGFGLIYTYRNGKIILVGNIDYDDGFYYYKKTGIFVTTYVMGGTGYKYYKLSKGKAAVKISKTKSYVVSSSGSSTKTTYYKSGNAITKKKFNSTLKKLVGSTKKSTLKLRKNTSANRKKYLK